MAIRNIHALPPSLCIGSSVPVRPFAQPRNIFPFSPREKG